MKQSIDSDEFTVKTVGFLKTFSPYLGTPSTDFSSSLIPSSIKPMYSYRCAVLPAHFDETVSHVALVSFPVKLSLILETFPLPRY